MGENTNSHQKKDTEFAKFAAAQMLPWIAVSVLVIASIVFVLGFFNSSQTTTMRASESRLHDSGQETAAAKESDSLSADTHQTGAGHAQAPRETSGVKTTHGMSADASHTTQVPHTEPSAHGTEAPAGHVPAHQTSPTHQKTTPVEHLKTEQAAPTHAAAPVSGGQAAPAHGAEEVQEETFPVVGMAFVNAVIKPMDYELNQRFYGWRPNDIADVTDNVNNFQLGVLEVTRRSAVILAERISRTGSAASFDKNLENAMNWFMIKADRYWFPSAESKYRAGLKELEIYFNKLKEGRAAFYTRTDNLIPLLASYQNLLGSCDENLIKMKEEDGSPISTFKADDYFFYAKGVASAMLTILKAIEQDFNIMVSREGGMEVLHHAIESCHHAVEIDPWIILNSKPSSIFANHRSNMAAPISHARFYLGVLIKALST
jgi:hypothetical protein